MRLDHAHLVCRDRPAMLAWLQAVFGLAEASEFADWSAIEGGPLFTKTPDGQNALALFHDPGAVPDTTDHTIGFVATPAEFLALLGRARALGLTNRFGKPLSETGATDHGLAMSLYFISPEDHRFEITCYDVEAVKAGLAAP